MRNSAQVFEIGSEEIVGEKRWEADFDPGTDWLIERQEPGSTVTFEDGRMRVNCLDAGGVTVWTRQEFPADLLVEYTATCQDPDRPSGRNLNCFLCAAEEPGRPLDETERSGAYDQYHDWPNYIFTLTVSHTRLRRDPGFEKVGELMMGVMSDESYTVRILKRGGRIVTTVNGHVLHDWTDDDPHGPGWVGLRTYDTDVTYDEWAVYDV